MPMNGTNSREYKGINALMLGLSGFTDVRWMTYKQAAERGGQVREGEKSTPIIFWKQSQVQDTNDHGETVTKTIPMLRYYAVFNVEQIDGLKLPKLAVQENPFSAIREAEAVIANMPQRPSIDHDGRNRTYYTPIQDSIHLPPQSAFESPDEYYSTLFHELGHSTGHETRLNRHGMETGIAPFGSTSYSKEELAAVEMYREAQEQLEQATSLPSRWVCMTRWSGAWKISWRICTDEGREGQRNDSLQPRHRQGRLEGH